jgi:hypothetical protein
MLGLTCLPDKVFKFLCAFKRHFRCVQARHHLIFSWVFGHAHRGYWQSHSRPLKPPGAVFDSVLAPVAPGGLRPVGCFRLDQRHGSGHAGPAAPPDDGALYLCADKTLKS